MYTLFTIMHALIIYVHFLQFRSEEVPSSNFIRSRVYIKHMILRWRTGKESTRQCRRCRRYRFNPCVGEDPREKEMATHSSILAWEIPRTEETGRLHSPWVHKRVRHDLATKHQQLLLAHSFYKGTWTHWGTEQLTWHHPAGKWQPGLDTGWDSRVHIQPLCYSSALEWSSIFIFPHLNNFLSTRIFTI